ncbi:hypothetical protein IV203_017172 [Nitzschia inconspicua]|uniref:Uncharacterized protein n=1 Tax=Nitzschia inconspicua TaxID=303405 RepID=A0A9K3KRA5_9STRA|nr:hypothetical protein IV203_017172 [Nitzschia inconspicua]
MTTRRHFNNTANTKPPPPPGLPTVQQRIQAMQFAARKHIGYTPNGFNEGEAMDVRKIVLPPEPLLAAGKIPNTIVISHAPKLHFDYDEEDDDDNQTNEELSLSSNDDVFRREHEEDSVEDDGNQEPVGGTFPRPIIQRQRAFAFAESIDSFDEGTGGDHSHAVSIQKSSRPRFKRGFMAAIYRATDRSEKQK